MPDAFVLVFLLRSLTRMLPSFAAAATAQDSVVIVRDESGSEDDGGGCYSDKLRRLDSVEEADSPAEMENPSFDGSARVQKRPRLVWTSQLHKRFVGVVAYLGIKNAVPKTVMHLMNVEGRTRITWPAICRSTGCT